MYFFDFQNKLQKLNPRLYCGEIVTQFAVDWKSVAIYYRRRTEEASLSSSLMANASADERKYIHKREQGDEFVSGVSCNWVPEYPYFSDKGRLLSKGWRSIVLEICRKKFVSLDKAKQVFNCRSLGESDFDKASFDLKRARLLDK